MVEKVLEVKNLKVYYRTQGGFAKAVDGVSFSMERGEIFGIVGESGCGKSTLAKALLRLIKPPGLIKGGRIVLDGLDLLQLSEEEMRGIRWDKISLIPQGSMNSLNPVMRVKDQIVDGIKAHQNFFPKKEIEKRVRELMAMVELPKETVRRFPHELSGGMKQRVCIAMAVALNPHLIVADEFTSALDVVVQRVVVQTLKKVARKLSLSLINIGHNMGLQAQLVDRMGIIYGGRLAEIGDVEGIYKEPLHPYTQLLIGSVPSIEERRELKTISGFPPSLLNPPEGCIFHPRCPYMKDVCRKEIPEWREIRPGRFLACHLY
jgi:peptide/nickel transport system ATP-binding protein